MLKTIAITTTLTTLTVLAAPLALAGPAEHLQRYDNRLTRAELDGRIAQGSPADYYENRIDRFEGRVDRHEDVRDRAVTYGFRDVREDRWDTRENYRDRVENGVDRRHH